MTKLKNKKSHKNSILASTALAISLAMFTFMVSQLANASTSSIATYPKSFIPFWSQARGGHEVALLNTIQIVRIEAVFNPAEDKPKHNDIVYLKVHMTDGKTLTVEEGFEDFYSRVRVSQSK
tara:strand:- start:889 stop:1254 length:366 start_codon:yes stop_codon:yes gene_type:complete